MNTSITKFDDVIDVRDVIAQVTDLRLARELALEHAHECRDSEDTCSAEEWAEKKRAEWEESDECTELASLEKFLSDMCGCGGDEQWEGDWYPVTAIRESYFQTYAQELADDIGSTTADAKWPYTCIDWEQAARELRMDYTGADFDGVTYYFR